jgi:hypothetical protein
MSSPDCSSNTAVFGAFLSVSYPETRLDEVANVLLQSKVKWDNVYGYQHQMVLAVGDSASSAESAVREVLLSAPGSQKLHCAPCGLCGPFMLF